MQTSKETKENQKIRYQFSCPACTKYSEKPGYCKTCAQEANAFFDEINQSFPNPTPKPSIMSSVKPNKNTSITDYLNRFIAKLGFNTIAEAKSILPKEILLSQAESFYISNNGAEGSILWTEILQAIQ